MLTSYFDVARARECGIDAVYRSPDELYMYSNTSHSSNASSSLRRLDTTRALLPRRDILRAVTGMRAYQNSIGVGCSGWGVDVHLLLTLPPVLLWFAVILLLRYVCRGPIAYAGMYMGVVTENSARYRERVASGKRGIAALSRRNRRKLFKFQNQVWLTVYYAASTLFGYAVQHDKPWFALPLGDDHGLHMLLPHPYTPPAELMLYYHYELAFYLSETVSLLYMEAEVKRSDFVEYLLHHGITVALIVCSHLAWEHRFGAYVLFLHDASDILLCLSKSIHYMVEEDAARATRYHAQFATIQRQAQQQQQQRDVVEESSSSSSSSSSDRVDKADGCSEASVACTGRCEDTSSSGSSSSSANDGSDHNDKTQKTTTSNGTDEDDNGDDSGACGGRTRQSATAMTTSTVTVPRYQSRMLFRYVLTETTTNCCFAGFIAVFFFMRLLCLPMMLRTTVGMATMVRHGNANMWALVVLLNVALQSLHVYWGCLIVNMIYSLLRGGARKDIRSDAEDDGEVPDVVSCGSAAVPVQHLSPPTATALAALRMRHLDTVVAATAAQMKR